MAELDYKENTMPVRGKCRCVRDGAKPSSLGPAMSGKRLTLVAKSEYEVNPQVGTGNVKTRILSLHVGPKKAHMS